MSLQRTVLGYKADTLLVGDAVTLKAWQQHRGRLSAGLAQRKADELAAMVLRSHEVIGRLCDRAYGLKDSLSSCRNSHRELQNRCDGLESVVEDLRRRLFGENGS